MEFLRDAGWQTIIGVLGIIVAVIIYLLQRSKKRLVYTILTETPLLSVNDEIKGKIKINYEAKEIQNLNLVILRIENRGNVHIAASDFEKPITFSFPNSEILSAEVTDVSPKNLKPEISANSSTLTVQPLLLNKRDFLTVKLVFSAYEKGVQADARVTGVKEIEKFDGSGSYSIEPPWRVALLLFGIVFFSALGTLLLLMNATSQEKDSSVVFSGWLIISISLLFSFGVFLFYNDLVKIIEGSKKQ
jgi:hypothetical protein